jgi:hypothetical protein
MNTDELRSDLHRLAGTAAPPSDLLADDVLHRRRAVRRQRVGVVGAVLAVLLVVAAVPWLVGGRGERVDQASPASGPRGSLAGDAAFLAGLRQLPWTYQQWHSPDGTGVTMDPQPAPAADWVSGVSDLAAGYTADQRRVVFAGDVPGGRWALVVLPSTAGDIAAWFSGPPGAAAGELTLAGMPWSVHTDEPLAQVDLASPERPLVVVTRPGDVVRLSERAVLEPDATLSRSFTTLPDEDGDGVVVTSLTASTRFGVAASVEVQRDGRTVWHTEPSGAGTAAGIDEDPAGWPAVTPIRPPMAADPGRDFLGQALSTALAAFGLDARELDGLEVVELLRAGPGADDTPVVTVYSIRLPSGARVLVGGWTNEPGDSAPDGVRPDQGVPYLDLRPADTEPATDLLAIDMLVDGAHRLVAIGPVTATAARVLDDDGATVTTVPLAAGTGSVPLPGAAATVQFLDADRTAGDPVPITEGSIGTWGNYGRTPRSSFPVPFPGPR